MTAPWPTLETSIVSWFAHAAGDDLVWLGVAVADHLSVLEQAVGKQPDQGLEHGLALRLQLGQISH